MRHFLLTLALTLASLVIGSGPASANSGWAQISCNASGVDCPTPRYGAGMSEYDTGNYALLFGGCTSGNGCNAMNSETWEWNGHTLKWTQLTPLHSPSARMGAAMAYDSLNGVIVLFGGLQKNASCNPACYTILGDTWIWNGTDWVSKWPSTSPAAVVWGTAADYGGEVVLFGGCTAVDSNAHCTTGSQTSQTLYWDSTNNNWVAQNSSACVSTNWARYQSGAALDNYGEIAMFGGAADGSPLGDTCTYDGLNWNHQSATGPSQRVPAGMAASLCSSPGPDLLFGGLNGPINSASSYLSPNPPKS
ncbi:MAG: Kelch repeat-containing protein [Actinomycetota bacterium]